MSIASGTLVRYGIMLMTGALVGYGARNTTRPSPSPECAPCADRCAETTTQSTLPSKIVELERSLALCLGRETDLKNEAATTAEQAAASGEQPATGAASEDTAPTPSPSAWRISAIEKFVPLSDEQRERLKAKFILKSDDPQAETLEQILGEDNARYYRNQVQSAFKRMEQQELDKEIVWVSRRLNLSDAQENSLRETFQRIEDQLSLESNGAEARGGTPQDRVQRMVEENKKRQSNRSEQLMGMLSAEQYKAYLKNQAESTESDMEVFHDPTAH